jgi:polyisoprenoid-binding protein YceI
MNKFLMICVFLIGTVSQAATLEPKSGSISFTAVGKPGFLKIKGESKKHPQGKLEIANSSASGSFLFDLENLNTGIALRDEHMKDNYLEVKKYPQAQLAIEPISIPNENTSSSGEFKGTLTLHGVTKNTSGKYTYDSSKKLVKAQFEILLSDFNINIPKYMGITVSEKVEVETTIEFGI